jgi:hypothetical protein
MAKHEVSKPQLFAVAITRVALGFGLGLLLSERIPARRKKRIGIGLLTAGIASTVPIALNIFSDRESVLNREIRDLAA